MARIQCFANRAQSLRLYSQIIVKLCGSSIVLEEIQQPQNDFASPREIFELALKHEQYITQSIYDLMDTAVEVKDHTTQIFLQWFITRLYHYSVTLFYPVSFCNFVKLCDIKAI